MGSNNKQRKSSGLFSIFNIFKSKSRGGYHYGDDEGRVFPSDYDNDNWGVADPRINVRAEEFIRAYRKRASETELRQVAPKHESELRQVAPAAENA